MRTIFKLGKVCVLTLLLMPHPALAQAVPKEGFIRLANAVSQGTGMLTMEVDGKTIGSRGFKIGEATGGITLTSGVRTVRFSRVGVEPGSTRVNVAGNETTTVIPYAEMVPATDEKPAHWAIRILRLKQQDAPDKRSATFVSVSSKPNIKVEIRDPDGNWSPVIVSRLATARVPILFPRGYVPLRCGDSKLTSIPVGEPGNYVVLLYDDLNEEVKSLNFKDVKILSAD